VAREGVEIETGRNPQAAVIWLHGLGADGHDFEPIVPELVQRSERALRFVFPDATGHAECGIRHACLVRHHRHRPARRRG